MKFEQKRPSGKHILELEESDEGLRRKRSVRGFTASLCVAKRLR